MLAGCQARPDPRAKENPPLVENLSAHAPVMKYYITAFAMGALWFVVLYPFAKALPLGGELFPFDLLAMCLASLTIAALFRRRIRQANRYEFMLLSVSLPCVGAFVFGVYLLLIMAVESVARNESLPEVASLMLPVTCVIYGAVGLFFVSIPLGFLSQYVMRKVSKLHA